VSITEKINTDLKLPTFYYRVILSTKTWISINGVSHSYLGM